MINLATIEKYVNYLNDLRMQSIKNNGLVRTDLLAKKHHINSSTFGYLVKLNYFERLENGLIMCKMVGEGFEPYHARKVLEYIKEYAKGHIKKIKVEKNLLFDTAINSNKDKKTIPPSFEEVKEYCLLRKNNVSPEKFYSHYESVNWRVGSHKMTNWKAAIHTWEQRSYPTIINGKNLSQYTDQELIEELKRRGYSGLIEIKREIKF